MNLIPPLDWSELATKSDVRRVDDRIDVLSDRIDVLSDRIDVLSDRIEDRFGLLSDRIEDRFGLLSDRVEDRFGLLSDRVDAISTTMATKTDLAVMRADLMRAFGTWLFASQAAVIVSLTVVFSFLR
jgi:uncharacterized Rmd1/YagE family protein